MRVCLDPTLRLSVKGTYLNILRKHNRPLSSLMSISAIGGKPNPTTDSYFWIHILHARLL